MLALLFLETRLKDARLTVTLNPHLGDASATLCGDPSFCVGILPAAPGSPFGNSEWRMPPKLSTWSMTGAWTFQVAYRSPTPGAPPPTQKPPGNHPFIPPPPQNARKPPPHVPTPRLLVAVHPVSLPAAQHLHALNVQLPVLDSARKRSEPRLQRRACNSEATLVFACWAFTLSHKIPATRMVGNQPCFLQFVIQTVNCKILARSRPLLT